MTRGPERAARSARPGPRARTGRGGQNIQGYGAGRAVAFKIFRAGRASGRRTNGPWRPYTLDHEGNTTKAAFIFAYFEFSNFMTSASSSAVRFIVNKCHAWRSTMSCSASVLLLYKKLHCKYIIQQTTTYYLKLAPSHVTRQSYSYSS